MTEQRWTLPRAFECTQPALVAIVGGGGKSSLMFALAADLPEPVVLSTTTRIFAAQMQRAAHTLFYSPEIPSDEFRSQPNNGRCQAWSLSGGERCGGEKAIALRQPCAVIGTAIRAPASARIRLSGMPVRD